MICQSPQRREEVEVEEMVVAVVVGVAVGVEGEEVMGVVV